MNLAASNPAAMIMDGFNLKPIQSAVPTIKIENGKYKIIRRMYFSRMMDFFVTEFLRHFRKVTTYGSAESATNIFL